MTKKKKIWWSQRNEVCPNKLNEKGMPYMKLDERWYTLVKTKWKRNALDELKKKRVCPSKNFMKRKMAQINSKKGCPPNELKKKGYAPIKTWTKGYVLVKTWWKRKWGSRAWKNKGNTGLKRLKKPKEKKSIRA